MPFVPENEDFGKVPTQGVPGAFNRVSASPADFGAQSAVALQRLGNAGARSGQVLAAEALRVQDEQDRNDAIAAYDSYSSQVGDLLYNQDTGLTFRKGSDARGVVDEFQKRHKEILSDIARKGQYNQEVQRKLGLSAARDRVSYLNRLGKHAREQHDAETMDRSELLIQNSLNIALQDPDNSDALAESDASIRQGIEDMPGLNPAQREILIQKSIGTLYRGIVNELSARDTPGAIDEAKAFFEQHKDKIPGTLHGSIERTLDDMGVDRVVLSRASEIMGQALTETEAIALAREESDDPDVSSKLVDEIKLRYRERDESQRDQNLEDVKRVRVMLDRDGGLQNVPEGLRSRLVEQGLWDGFEQRVKQLRAGTKTADNWPLFFRVQDLATGTTEDKKGFLDMETQILDAYNNGQISDKHMGEIGGFRVSVAQELSSGQVAKDLSETQSLASFTNDYLGSLGIDTTNKANEEESRQAVLFRAKLQQAINAREIVEERKLSQAEWVEEADKLGQQIATDSAGFWEKAAQVFIPKSREGGLGKDFLFEVDGISGAEAQLVRNQLSQLRTQDGQEIPVDDNDIAAIMRIASDYMVGIQQTDPEAVFADLVTAPVSGIPNMTALQYISSLYLNAKEEPNFDPDDVRTIRDIRNRRALRDNGLLSEERLKRGLDLSRK